MKLLLIVSMILGLAAYANCDGSLLLIEKGIQQFLHNNTKPDYLQNAIDNISKIKNSITRNKAKCNTCLIVVNSLLKLRRAGASREKLLDFGENLCHWFVTRQKYCRSFLDLQLDAALYIIDNNPGLTAEHACAIKMQDYDCVDPEYDAWSVSFPPKVKEIASHNISLADEEFAVHLTDIHYDVSYDPGANTECQNFICCQKSNGKAPNGQKGAGFWGDYHACNTPLHTLDDLLKQIKKQHKRVDRIYYTGDIASHTIWASTKVSVLDAIKTLADKLRVDFKGIPVYPVLGNHDTHPTDLYPPSNLTDKKLSNQWLLDFVAEEWATWLPSDTKTTLRKGGYYTALVKPGFRIVGLNNNIAYTDNLWLIVNQKDPQDQLQWLADTLVDAEKNNERVHILSHIPPGDHMSLKQWNHEYRRIIDRFSHIISGQFHGHTHVDQLKIFYGLENPNEVVSVSFIGGSFTTFIGYNPNYRVYNVDPATWKVNDYEQWMFNMEEANRTPNQSPKWYKHYSFKNAYYLNNLEFASYHELLQNMSRHGSLIEQYHRFGARSTDKVSEDSCNKECLANTLCKITEVEYEESLQCKAFRSQLNVL